MYKVLVRPFAKPRLRQGGKYSGQNKASLHSGQPIPSCFSWGCVLARHKTNPPVRRVPRRNPSVNHFIYTSVDHTFKLLRLHSPRSVPRCDQPLGCDQPTGVSSRPFDSRIVSNGSGSSSCLGAQAVCSSLRCKENRHVFYSVLYIA